MSIYQEVYDKFVCLLGEPRSEESLKEYILFVFDNQTSKETDISYCEDHHIIPRCILENDLCYTLSYENHVNAHVLLTYAYPISAFVRPLNFMLGRKEKESIEYRKMWSDAVKNSWKSFRCSKKYKEWREKIAKHGRSERNLKHIRNVMTPASIAARENPIKEAKRIQQIKDYWTEERKLEKSQSLKEYNLIHGTQRYIDALNKRWDTISKENYDKFCKKMSIVNKDPQKRLEAGIKIKNRWDNYIEYQNKMKNRKSRGSDGTKNKEMWCNPVYREKQTKMRKLSHIKRKAPPEIKELISSMTDSEIIEKYGHLSRKPCATTPNKELKNRIEVIIIKEYKSKYKIKYDKITSHGWYRRSCDDLQEIIKLYHQKYGMLETFKENIKEILNETN